MTFASLQTGKTCSLIFYYFPSFIWRHITKYLAFVYIVSTLTYITLLRFESISSMLLITIFNLGAKGSGIRSFVRHVRLETGSKMLATMKDATDLLRNLNLHCHHLRANFPADYDKRASLARLTTACGLESPMFCQIVVVINKHSIFTAFPWQQKLSMVFIDSGGSSVSQNKLPQLILGYIYILKHLQSNFIG